ncbi:MAG: hypothetical protein HYY13_05245 [Nitrospirae bacterium]|nr:hypothetical protein [Nitrospirota bacterium]
MSGPGEIIRPGEIRNILCGHGLAVRCDSLDVEALEENLAPEDRERVVATIPRLPAADRLLQDLFSIFFKAAIRLHAYDQLSPSAMGNRLLIEATLRSTGYAEKKRGTVLNERAATGAAVATLEKLGREMDKLNLSMAGRLHRLEADLARRLDHLTGRNNDGDAAYSAWKGTRQGAEFGAIDDNLQCPPHGKLTLDAQPLPRGTRSLGWGPLSGDLPAALPPHERMALERQIMTLERFRRFLRMLVEIPPRAGDTLRRILRTESNETHDITMGNELGRLLPMELTALAGRISRKGFFKRLRDSELLQYDLSTSPRPGPLVACVDTSHSMEGEKDLFAKALALAFSQAALEHERTFRAILFGAKNQPPRVVSFERPRSEDLIELAEFAFGGGTDFELPLRTAMRIQEEHVGEGGDIVFLTDGRCALPPGFADEILREKRRLDVRITVIVMDVGESTTLTLQPPLSDAVYTTGQLLAAEGST